MARRSAVADKSFMLGHKAGREEMRVEALGLFEKYIMDETFERGSREYDALLDLTRRAAQELKA